MSLHKNIRRFTIDGTVRDDSDFIRTRDTFELIIVRGMRDEGYVPVLGLGPSWSTEYNEEDGDYSFVLTMYGVYVGKRRSHQLEGVDAGGKWFERT